MPQGQDTGQPPHSLEPPPAWEGVDSGHRDAGAGSRPWGCGRAEVAMQGCGPGPWPPCLAGPAPRRPLAPGPAGLAVSPSTCLLRQVLGRAPRQVQPLYPAGPPRRPRSPSSARGHRQAPGVTSVVFVQLGADDLSVSGGCSDQKTGEMRGDGEKAGADKVPGWGQGPRTWGSARSDIRLPRC